jgi:hypothetical protein
LIVVSLLALIDQNLVLLDKVHKYSIDRDEICLVNQVNCGLLTIWRNQYDTEPGTEPREMIQKVKPTEDAIGLLSFIIWILKSSGSETCTISY